jgi:transketolase
MNTKMCSVRDAYGETLAEIGADERVVSLDADLSKSTKSSIFAERFPNRFFDFGVAEQNMFGTAAGLALSGKVPFASTFAVFVCRCFDQIRASIAYPKLNVRIVGSHAGISAGEDGATHQALEDIALMRTLGNMTVLAPCDATEMKLAVRATMDVKGPVYIRTFRPKSPVIFDKDYDYEIGTTVTVKDGSDVTLMAHGIMVSEAVKASELLKEKGISAEVMDVHTIKPLDTKTILAVAKKTGRIITCEDHSIYGGLGSAVAEVLAEDGNAKMARIGLKGFAESGTTEELFNKYGLSSAAIAKTAEEFIR